MKSQTKQQVITVDKSLFNEICFSQRIERCQSCFKQSSEKLIYTETDKIVIIILYFINKLASPKRVDALQEADLQPIHQKCIIFIICITYLASYTRDTIWGESDLETIPKKCIIFTIFITYLASCTKCAVSGESDL